MTETTKPACCSDGICPDTDRNEDCCEPDCCKTEPTKSTGCC